MSEELINKLQESILLKNYTQAVETCQDIELEVSANYPDAFPI